MEINASKRLSKQKNIGICGAGAVRKKANKIQKIVVKVL